MPAINNPYAPPRTELNHIDINDYVGIGRVGFFLGLSALVFFFLSTIVISLLFHVPIPFLGITLFYPFIPFWLISLTLTGLMFGLIVLRLKNTGYSWLWALLLFMPVINVILIIYCLVSPTNYKNKQTPSSEEAWKVIIVLSASAFTIIIILPFLSILWIGLLFYFYS